MRLKTKLTFLIVFCMSVSIGLAVFNKEIERKRLDSIFHAAETAWKTVFDKTFDLVGQSLETFAYDYTYWDEMVGFLKTGDRAWAAANIDSSLATYRANAVWICKMDRSLLYSTDNLQDERLRELPVPWPAVSDLFQRSRLCHFFARTPKGLMEIRGATVHPSLDPERKTEPAGYFFAGRLWNDKYLQGLAAVTGMKVSVTPVSQAGWLEDISDAEKGQIAFSRILRNWDGVPIARLDVLKISKAVEAFNQASGQMIAAVVIYSGILIIVLFISLTCWITMPLERITKAILDKKPIQEKGLMQQNNEFGVMASIMNKFFEQRERLISEIVGHRKAASQLRLSEEKFAKAFRANPNPMAIFLRDDGRFLDANEAFLSLTGYGRDRVVNHSLEELNIFPRNHRLAVIKLLKEEGRLYNIELDVTTASGKVRNSLFSASTIEVGKDNIIIAVANDITERKKAESELGTAQRQLMQSEKMAAMGRFASGLAHEIKNPLAILLGGMEYLKSKLPGSDKEVRESLVKMHDAVTRANAIVKDLLSFARPSKAVYEKVHPNSFVHEAIDFAELLKHKSDTAKVDIRQELTDEEIRVEIDKNQMQQALFNILLNAIEAIPVRGEIVVRTYPADSSCVIEVQDTGEGIAKEDMPKLFELFFTTKRGQKGTGLGLPIVKDIVERHKGTIAIESVVGKGTKVRITLPIAAA